jgi:hypothetical protein
VSTPSARDAPESLIARGWQWAEATLAAAPSPRRLVTHWFAVAGDASVHADDHFGSDARTLRFLAVVLPTLITELDARAAVLAVPWAIDGDRASITVVALTANAPAALATRTLARAAHGPPFWRIGAPVPAPPPEIAAICAGLVIPAAT